MNILDIAIAKQLAGGGGSGTVTSVSVQGASGSHLTGSGNPIETSGTITIDVDEGYSIPSNNKQNAWDIKAADLKFEINSSTFVITAQLKDSNGNFIGHERTIDLPLETMVVDGTYDSQTQKIKLELKNGNFVEFSVADLVSGLQTELSASNKLDPDYIDYDASHRAVSDTEKDTWNAKQNAISDLETIRSGAAAGATAVQPATMTEALAAKQNSLNAAQLAAVNSGIDSDDVAQIGTNQTNILLVQDATEQLVDKGAKNKIYAKYPSETQSTLNFTVNADNSVTVTGSLSSESTRKTYLFTDEYTVADGDFLSGCPSGGSNTTYDLIFLIDSSHGVRDFGNGVDLSEYAGETGYVMINIRPGQSNLNLTFKPMICTKAEYDISPNYEPYALPNYDLTRELAELNAHPFLTVPSNHNMVYRGKNLGDTLTADQDTALSSGNFTGLYLGDYWTKAVTIPAFYEVTTAEPANWSTNYTSYYTKSGDTYTPVSGDTAPTWAANTYYERLVSAQTVTLKAVIADFDTFYAGYASSYAGINTHHAAVIVHGFNNVVWNKTNTTAGGYVNSLIHKWLVGSALPQIETWFGSAKVLSHQKLLTNAITGDAASGWAWSSQKISLLSENQMYGSKVWGNSKASNGGYEPGEAFKHLNVFNHVDANLLFGNRNIWLRDIASAVGAAVLYDGGYARNFDASNTWVAPAALILLS